MNKELTKSLVYKLHPLERKVLVFLLSSKNLDELVANSKLTQTECVTALQLLKQREYVNYLKKEEVLIVLDKFGEEFVKSDLPEAQVLNAIKDFSKKISELQIDKGIVGSALGELKRQGLADVRKEDELILSITPKGGEFLSFYSNPLKEFEKGALIEKLSKKQKEILENFKLRKGFLKQETKKSFSFSLTKEGEKLAKEIKDNYSKLELLETITSEMLKNSSWKGKKFRYYEVGVQTSLPDLGRRHPMHEANKILSDIFIEMGFSEMEGPIVESAFWNMDLLWIPQDHPARDEQDTFYIEGEAKVPQSLVKKVKEMHEGGIKLSHTPTGDFSNDITKKRLLRTHSTATSFRTLAELGKKHEKGGNINGKYFYVAHNFRNEAVDATHLAEFFQAEGFIVGDDLSLADLMGFVKEYYAKLGIHKIRFKPTYNPYTEPSMEAHYYDEKLGKWYALINSGIFRPETLQPLGLGGKTILAWGMGASRVATLLTGAKSMRDITGATCDLEWLKSRPTMRREITRK